MGIFDDDPFQDIMREFFGETQRAPRRERIIRGEEEERVIDLTEDDKHIYFIFELPGYIQEDVEVTIQGRSIAIKAQKSPEGMKDYLTKKLARGVSYTRTLPDFIVTKGFSYTVKNGVVEVTFLKK